jgi:hypothetical protein
MIDPTTADNWLRDNFRSRPYVEHGDKFEDFQTAYRYGAAAESKYGDAGIDLNDEQLKKDWEASKEFSMPWTKAKRAVHDAYNRTVELRRERVRQSEADRDLGRSHLSGEPVPTETELPDENEDPRVPKP